MASRNGHDIVVIGGSAGGIEALHHLLPPLPEALNAAIFIVVHIGERSYLSEVLERCSRLPVLSANHSEAFRRGHVYVAEPGRHMLLHDQHIVLRRGPRENMARPAVDPLFRSAAANFGGRVIGIILSGALNDGTTGLRAIQRCGGMTVVQRLDDAIVSGMPKSALQVMAVDHCASAAEIGCRLAEWVAMPAAPTPEIPDDIRLETAIAMQELSDMATQDKLGTPSHFSCPECQGVLWEIRDDPLVHYRCHTGHAYTEETMLAAQSQRIEEHLYGLMRAHSERAALSRRLAEAAPAEQKAKWIQRAREYEEDAEVLRRIIGAHGAVMPAETDHDKAALKA